MAKRLDPRQIAKLAQVQHVRKAACDASLILASAAESAARAERTGAEGVAASAIDDWHGCMSGLRFEPERARDLAARLIQRETALNQAVTAHDDATELHARRQADWRMAAARVERADTMVKDARRIAGQAREERRLTELCDRVSYAWSQP